MADQDWDSGLGGFSTKNHNFFYPLHPLHPCLKLLLKKCLTGMEGMKGMTAGRRCLPRFLSVSLDGVKVIRNFSMKNHNCFYPLHPLHPCLKLLLKKCLTGMEGMKGMTAGRPYLPWFSFVSMDGIKGLSDLSVKNRNCFYPFYPFHPCFDILFKKCLTRIQGIKGMTAGRRCLPRFLSVSLDGVKVIRNVSMKNHNFFYPLHPLHPCLKLLLKKCLTGMEGMNGMTAGRPCLPWFSFVSMDGVKLIRKSSTENHNCFYFLNPLHPCLKLLLKKCLTGMEGMKGMTAGRPCLPWFSFVSMDGIKGLSDLSIKNRDCFYPFHLFRPCFQILFKKCLTRIEGMKGMTADMRCLPWTSCLSRMELRIGSGFRFRMPLHQGVRL